MKEFVRLLERTEEKQRFIKLCKNDHLDVDENTSRSFSSFRLQLKQLAAAWERLARLRRVDVVAGLPHLPLRHQDVFAPKSGVS